MKRKHAGVPTTPVRRGPSVAVNACHIHFDFVPPSVPPALSPALPCERNPHGGATFGLVAVSLEAVSKTVSGVSSDEGDAPVKR
jgi:hypothetical protein